MSDDPNLFESIRRKRQNKGKRVGFFSLSIMIRAALILTLGAWLMWKLYPVIVSTPEPPSEERGGDVTFAEPEDIE